MLTIYRDTGHSVRTSSALDLPKEVIWIDLHNPTEEERAFVKQRAGFLVPHREALSEIESSSRLIVDGDVIHLSTPLVAAGDPADTTMTPVGFILSPSLLVTIR